MRPTLEARIDAQDSWTFHECLGLSAEYNIKVRAIIAMVYVRGKVYVDRTAKDGEQGNNEVI